MPLDLLTTLCDLVALPSVNPMGRDVSGQEFYEHRVTAYLQDFFTCRGWAWQRQTIAPLRENILARLDGQIAPERGGPLLLLEAHQDTVPVDGMTIPPFAPELKEGRVYGRGACDIKGGMAAMLAALDRLGEVPQDRRPTVVLACTVNEEHGFTGAQGVARLWSEGNSKLLPRRPDAAIVAEPTDLHVVVAHKGMVRWRMHALGRAAHSSRPEAGDNAIFHMARALSALERYQRDVAPALAVHPLCGRPTLSVGTIQGGLSVNTVPDRCTIEIDRRLAPGESPQAAYQHVIDFLQAELGASAALKHDPLLLQSAGLSDGNNTTLAERLASAAREIAGRGERIGVPYGTDAAVYSAAGVPSVVFGPGSIAQAHTADEWVPLDEVATASDVLYRFLYQFS